VDKRFQVFVSSTFRDLQEERQQVLRSLLELNCMPCSMEYFPASDDEVWIAIQALIKDCDYYIVIVAGRYGSVAEDGLSYTRKEYDYAVEIGKPVLAFLHRILILSHEARRRAIPRYRKNSRISAYCAGSACARIGLRRPICVRL
jgi:Domain of unknown function (DUF4062)